MSGISFEQSLINVWQQALVDNARSVALGDETYPVRKTTKNALKRIDFRFAGRNIRGLEQNQNTKSRWAALARSGHRVMQFLEGGQYIAVVADVKLHTYGN
jgi:hypothetical protein